MTEHSVNEREEMLSRIAGWQCPSDIECDLVPFTRQLTRFIDEDDTERGERINGVVQCPKCSLCWPIIEEPDAWEENPLRVDTVASNGMQLKAGYLAWRATEWSGFAQCLECDVVMVEGIDGRMLTLEI